MTEHESPDLYFATVKAMGTDLDMVESGLRASLERAGYQLEVVRLSELLATAVPDPRGTMDSKSQEYVRRNVLMSKGDWIRTQEKSGVARLGVNAIAENRRNVKLSEGRRGRAFLIKSLMHEAEVSLYRNLFGSLFFLVSVFRSEQSRRQNIIRDLESDITSSNADMSDKKVSKIASKLAKDLMLRDRGWPHEYRDQFDEVSTKPIERLSIEDTFFEGDLFINGESSSDAVLEDIDRLVRLIFSDPFGIAKQDECGIAQAFTAASQSTALPRRVGASLYSGEDLVATGRNDMPRARGGQLTYGTDKSDSSLREESDISGAEKQRIFTDLVSRLMNSQELTASPAGASLLESVSKPKDLNRLVKVLMEEDDVRLAEFFSMVEFDPAMHAEMSALLSAARRQAGTDGTSMYVTTHPCHECTRHIIGSGVTRVVYLEPYPKSKAEHFFGGEVNLVEKAPPTGNGSKPTFEPFMGIAPRRHHDLFSWLDRRKNGKAIRFTLSRASEIRPSLVAFSDRPEAQRMSKAMSKTQSELAEEFIQELEVYLVGLVAAFNEPKAPE